MKIIICEDNKEILTKIKNIIESYITINDWDLKIKLATDNPNTVLNHINEKELADCYFLDIDLGNDIMNGIELGKKIRNKDPFAKLIFITSFDEMYIKILDEMISPLAYIIKDTDKTTEKIRSSLCVAYDQYLSSLKKNTNIGKIPIQIGNRQTFFNVDDVLYFEAIGNHKVSLKLANGEEQQFFGKISEIEHLHNNFFCCHRSYIVNLESIIDSKKDIVIFKNNISLLLTDKATRKIRKSLKNIEVTSH